VSPYVRIALYYVTQFLPAGAMHAFAGIWLSSHGLSGFEIGAVTTVPIALILLTNVFVGRLADKARDWRIALQICSATFLVFTTGLFWADSFWPILLCFTGTNIAGAFAAPIGDAAALHLTSKGRGHIGTLRGFATAGYMGALFITGFLTETYGAIAFLIVSLAFAFLRLAASLWLPNIKSDEEAAASSPSRLGYRTLLRPHLFWPLTGWAIGYATIMSLNSFLSVHLKNQGIATSTISWLIAIGAFTEVLVFFAFRKFEHKLDLRIFILISGATLVLRWLAMSTEPSLPMLFVLQATHGVSYALGFVACLSFISKNTSSAEAAEVQSFFNVLQMITAVLFITAFGSVFDSFGAKSFLLSAAVTAIGAIIIATAFVTTRKSSQ
jgi:MFS transporter, PPP family, 3-phenylpropionic acid transporter